VIFLLRFTKQEFYDCNILEMYTSRNFEVTTAYTLLCEDRLVLMSFLLKCDDASKLLQSNKCTSLVLNEYKKHTVTPLQQANFVRMVNVSMLMNLQVLKRQGI